MCTLDQQSPAWQPYIFLGLLGVGFGGSFVTNLIGVLVFIPHDVQAVVQGAQWAIRSLGIAVTLTTSSALFQAVSRKLIREGLKDDDLASHFSNTLALSSPAFINAPVATQQVVLDSYSTALSTVLYALLAQAVLGVAVSLFITNEQIED